MKNIKLKFLTTTSDRSKTSELIQSLSKFGWDFHIIEHEWNGFLGKITETYKYLPTLLEQGYTHFIYSDAWDSVTLSSMEEVIHKMKNLEGCVYSVEKACYPHSELAVLYPECSTDWKYINGGGWYSSIEFFQKMVERSYPQEEMNDQVWAHRQFIENNLGGLIQLDTECKIFQTIGFEGEGDFSYTGNRLFNIKTDQLPVFIHGNGHTPMTKIYDLIK